MRVLHVISRLDNKPFALAQVESLNRNGIEADIFSLNDNRNALNYFTGIFKLKKRLKRIKYDLVHAHYAYCGLVALLQKKVPVIVSFMGNDLQGILGPDGKQTLLGAFNVAISSVVAKNADAVIVKSNRMKKKLKLNDVYVIPNGVDFVKFKPVVKTRSEVSRGKLNRVLFVAYEPKSRNKNLDLSIQAVEILKNSAIDVQLSVISNVAQEKVAELMNETDVLLLTSLSEGSPNVIKEAMACNCPIVATDVGDVREVIGDTEGCFIAAFEPKDVAEKIKKALDFGKRTNGRENIGHLEMSRIAKKIIAVYNQALQK